MAQTTGTQIAEAALALGRSHPRASALEILDQVMLGHSNTSPSFDNGLIDHTDPGQPFADLLREAFRDPHGADDAYSQQLLIDRFADRYGLWQA